MALLTGLVVSVYNGAALRLDAQKIPGWTVSISERVVGEGAGELFERVAFGRMLPDGRTVVADGVGLFLRVYSSDGTRVVQMGKEGEGPGEFRAIHGLWITDDGNIGAWDGRVNRLTIFEPEGHLVDVTNVRADDEMAAGNLELFHGAFANGDILLGSIIFDRRSASPRGAAENIVLGRFSPNGTLVKVLGAVPGMVRALRAPLPFTPVPRVAVRGESVWVSTAYDSVVEEWDGTGELRRDFQVPDEAEYDPDEAWTVLESELRRMNSQLLLDILREIPRSADIPTIGGVIVDDSRRVWVKTYDPNADAVWLKRNALEIGDGGRWWVFSDGDLVASADMPQRFVPLEVRGNSVLGIVRNELEVERVVIRTILR